MLTLCEHPEIAYETSSLLVLPFRWEIHTLRCTWCEAKAFVADRKKV